MKKESSYKIPFIIQDVMQTIKDRGYACFIIGGYVRDLLLGMNSLDIDICTNAPLIVLKKLFKGKVYKEYSSIHFIKEPYNIDITTFREELEYKDNKPSKIMYTNKLYTDLLRRDFTINALALDINGNIIDLLNALKDIKHKKIKVIGNAYERFAEDKTRILRAIRLSNNLEFDLDTEILSFLKEKGYLLKTLKKEYIKSELDKIFEYPKDSFFKLLKKYELSEYLHLKYSKINTNTSSSLGIWAQIETDLPFKKDDKIVINSIKKIISKGKIEKIDIYRYGEYISSIASEILLQNIDDLIINMPIRSIFDIDITFEEIKQISKTNKINAIYKDLENQILSDKLQNKKENIIKYIRGKYE